MSLKILPNMKVCKIFPTLFLMRNLKVTMVLKGQSQVAKVTGDIYKRASDLEEMIVDFNEGSIAEDDGVNLDSVTQFMVELNHSDDSMASLISSENDLLPEGYFLENEEENVSESDNEYNEPYSFRVCEPVLASSPEKIPSLISETQPPQKRDPKVEVTKPDDVITVPVHTGVMGMGIQAMTVPADTVRRTTLGSEVLDIPDANALFSGATNNDKNAQGMLNSVDSIIKEQKHKLSENQEGGGDDLIAGFASLSASPPLRSKSLLSSELDIKKGVNGSELSPSNSMSNVQRETKEKEASSLIEKRDAWVKTIANFFPGSSSDQQEGLSISAPFPPEEHYVILPQAPNVAYVNEKEPSTIITWALQSKQYQDFLKTGHPSKNSSTAIDEVEEMGVKSNGKKRSEAPNDQVGNLRNDDVMNTYFNGPKCYSTEEDVTGTNSILNDCKSSNFSFLEKRSIEGERDCICEFTEGRTVFSCKIYYALEFAKLRRLCLEGSDHAFLLSLSKSMKWQTTGGKSGSAFSKMADDRFIMKEMSRLEVQSFIEFGQEYFDYTMENIRSRRPSVLAKILGVFRISFKNGKTGRHLQHVLIMENLFYDKKISRIFDLKGSMRSRYVQSTGKENDVLMDENLLEFIYESPLFLRPHSKTVLKRCIWNDTMFLCNLQVMDYSLLVGIDETNKQLVIGIIDYIRTSRGIRNWRHG